MSSVIPAAEVGDGQGQDLSAAPPIRDTSCGPVGANSNSMWKRTVICLKYQSMSHFDELPRRDRSHEIEDEALVAFQGRIKESGCFILQASDRKDYGTDCQVEVVADGQATNVRVHVQLKGLSER